MSLYTRYVHYDSPLGFIQLQFRDCRLWRVELCDGAYGLDADPAADMPEGVRRFVLQLDRYFSGQSFARSFAQLCPDSLTPFRKDIYRALLNVGFGQVVSYGQLAEMAGNPGAYRAVGTALAKNPLPLFIPCHRVIRSDGTAGGFVAGTAWKQRLLAHEGIYISS
jgi:methylated-DNA-[protein]-cysteine S-methyltransferase